MNHPVRLSVVCIVVLQSIHIKMYYGVTRVYDNKKTVWLILGLTPLNNTSRTIAHRGERKWIWIWIMTKSYNVNTWWIYYHIYLICCIAYASI